MAVCGAAGAEAGVVSAQHRLFNLAVHAAGVLAVDSFEYFPSTRSRVW